MRLASVVFAVVALLLLGAGSASAGPFDYLCHDRGDGAYDHIHVDTLAEAEAHVGHAGDIIPDLFYGSDPEIQVGPQNYGEGYETQEDIWSMSCAVPVDDTPPPAPTEVVDPYGDGEDENGLIPDDDGEDIDEELNSQPFADQAAGTDAAPVEQGEVVTQLPDAGVGDYPGRPESQWGRILVGAIAGLVIYQLARLVFRRRA